MAKSPRACICALTRFAWHTRMRLLILTRTPASTHMGLRRKCTSWCVCVCVCVCVVCMCVCVYLYIYIYGSQGQEHKLEVSKMSIQLVENALIAANNHAKAHLVPSSLSPSPICFAVVSPPAHPSSSFSFPWHVPRPPCSSLSSFFSSFIDSSLQGYHRRHSRHSKTPFSRDRIGCAIVCLPSSGTRMCRMCSCFLLAVRSYIQFGRSRTREGSSGGRKGGSV